VNAEVSTVVEKEEEREEGRAECAVVELGEVSKDTHGHIIGIVYFDPGTSRWWG
jgi:hypothetical protein